LAAQITEREHQLIATYDDRLDDDPSLLPSPLPVVWKDLGVVHAPRATKKNLVSCHSYSFRVRPEVVEGVTYEFSRSSEVITTAKLAPFFTKLGKTLLSKADGNKVAVDELAGKVVGELPSSGCLFVGT